MSLIVKVWLKSLAYPSGEEGGKFLVQMISTCLRYTQRRGGGDPRPVGWTYETTRKAVTKGKAGMTAFSAPKLARYKLEVPVCCELPIVKVIAY